MASIYFSGQGKVYAAERNTDGTPKGAIWLGNVPELELSFEEDTAEHKESNSGNRRTDLILTNSQSANLTMTLEEFLADNLALGLFGQKATTAAASVTDESFAEFVEDQRYFLAHPGVSALSIEDSAGTPATLVEDTDYTLNADHGSIEIIADQSGKTAPFLVDYDFAEHTDVGMFTQAAPERFLRFEGLNTAESPHVPVVVELYRVRLNPFGGLPMIQDGVGQFPLTGAALVDSNKAEDATLGQIGAIIRI